MKRILAICMTLGCCLSFSLAQGIQGNVKLTGKATVDVTGHAVTLSWTASTGASSYCVYRGTAHGQYSKVASGILGTSFTDVQITRNQTLYYVTTAMNGSGESNYSNETVAVVP